MPVSVTKKNMIGLKSSLYQPLTAEDVKRIAEAAFEVLEKSGMAVYSKTAFEALKAKGADVDAENMIVKMPRSMVEDAIDSNPSSITLYSRDGQTDIKLEDNRVHYGTGGTAIYVIDPDTGQRRPSKNDDVVLNARLVDRLDNIHLFTINVFPNDIDDKDSIDVNRFFHALDNTRKHIMGGIYSLKGCKEAVEMAQLIAGGAEQLRDKPFVSFITLIISPFKIDDHYGEMTCYLAKEGLPVVVPTEPICGTTSPITLAGNVLTHIAETIGGITLVQSINKGAPGICGSVGSITDLRTMNHLGGPVERAMINASVSQLAQHFKIPLYSTAGTTDSKGHDMQSAYESGMSNLLVAMSGANYIHDSAGLMEADLTVSYRKLVIDDEILGMCQRVLKGVEVNDDTLGVDMLIEKGPAKDYLAEEHTIKHMHDEFFMPKLANRDKREQCQDGDDAIGRAGQFVQSVRSQKAESCLEADTREQILKKFENIKAVD
jgi:trimethylamine--corrinoid protein Co-methyltransferase